MGDTFTIDKKLKIGFGLAIFFVLIVGVISILTFKQQNDQARLVTHTYNVINEVTQLEALLVDMETGRRGFRSTNDKKFLQPYFEGLPQVRPSIRRIEEFVKEKDHLQDEITGLYVQVDSILSFWATLGIDASLYTREDVARFMNIEKVLMDRVRQTLAVILREHKNELAAREKETQRIVNRALIELVIGILFILLLVIALIVQVIKEFRTRRRTQAALQQGNEDLILINEESSNQNWLLTGVAEIGNNLHGFTDVEKLSESILQTTVSYLEVDAGALYLFNTADEKLYLSCGSALPSGVKKIYNLHEGWVGQAATEEKRLVIANLKPEHTTIESATVKATPVEALYAPIVHDGELKGVLELLKLHSFDEKEIKLLDVVTGNFAVAIHSVQARQKVFELLGQVQKQKEALEHQQEELRQVNEELSQQAEVLQASEEEMRVQEEELRQINAELEEKNEVIETARRSLGIKAKELENISRYKSEFLANMSHELRTPLNSILILARLLADNTHNNLTEKQVAHAKIIHKSGSDLLQLINDILDLSKIESGKMEINYEEIRVQSVCANMQQLFAMVAEEKHINYTTTISKDVPEKFTTDKQKLEQVLINLLSNAFKFTNEKGTVSLNISIAEMTGKPCLAFSVTDTGIGIAAHKQHLIFEAFRQADSSTSRKYGGTGLGLSIISRLVQVLQGVVKLESEEGKGSTFSAYIPLHPGDSLIASPSTVGEITETNSSQEEENAFSSSVAEAREDNNLMLIVEDDEALAEVISDYAHSKKYRTIVAGKGDEGLDYARRYKPSVIILDMKLPGMDGNTVLKHLKSDPDLQQIPVHVISSVGDLKTAPGALSFLKKPFNIGELDHAFSVIGNYLKVSVKRVLIVSQNEQKMEELESLAKQGHLQVTFDKAPRIPEAAEMLKQKRFHTIIADISGNVKEGMEQLRWLNAQNINNPVPTIIVVDEDISQVHELDVKRVADVVVRKSGHSHKRLMDELELFLYKVKEEKQGNNFNGTSTALNVDLLHGKKVLVADDDMRNVFALSAALEHEQMNVIVASDGKEAIDILSQQKDIDIVLMDIMMPEMDGYEATRYIREQLDLKSLPVIALTAKAMANDREKCIEAGASDYITKPVDVHKLISLMRVWLA